MAQLHRTSHRNVQPRGRFRAAVCVVGRNSMCGGSPCAWLQQIAPRTWVIATDVSHASIGRMFRSRTFGTGDGIVSSWLRRVRLPFAPFVATIAIGATGHASILLPQLAPIDLGQALQPKTTSDSSSSATDAPQSISRPLSQLGFGISVCALPCSPRPP
jgi:hypothetical protein